MLNLVSLQYFLSANIIGFLNCPTCNVPQLKPDSLRVPVQDFQGEIHSDRGPVVTREGLVNVTPDDGGLPDSEVSDDQHLVQVLLPETLHAVGLQGMVRHFTCWVSQGGSSQEL